MNTTMHYFNEHTTNYWVFQKFASKAKCMKKKSIGRRYMMFENKYSAWCGILCSTNKKLVQILRNTERYCRFYHEIISYSSHSIRFGLKNRK